MECRSSQISLRLELPDIGIFWIPSERNTDPTRMRISTVAAGACEEINRRVNGFICFCSFGMNRTGPKIHRLFSSSLPCGSGYGFSCQFLPRDVSEIGRNHIVRIIPNNFPVLAIPVREDLCGSKSCTCFYPRPIFYDFKTQQSNLDKTRLQPTSTCNQITCPKITRVVENPTLRWSARNHNSNKAFINEDFQKCLLWPSSCTPLKRHI